MHIYQLATALLGLAIVDSMNPSAIAVTVGIIHSGPAKKKNRLALTYILGVMISYLSIGILILLGFQLFFEQISAFADTREAYYIQAMIGAIMFIWSWFPPQAKKQSEPTFLENVLREAGTLKMLLLGASITMAELITAVPYLGAIVLLQQADIYLGTKIALLIAYNGIMVLPPLMILLGYNFNRNRFDLWLAKRKAKSKDKPSDALQWVVGIIGFIILADAINFFMR